MVDVAERKSYPLAIARTVQNEFDKPASKNRKKRQPKKPKARPGRRTGSRNRDKTRLKLSPGLWRINEMLVLLLKLIRGFIKVRYLAMDGYFGHSQAVLMAKENGLELISKLRRDAAIFEKYKGSQKAKGAGKEIWGAVEIRSFVAAVFEEKRTRKRSCDELLARRISAQRVWRRVECRDHRQTKLENEKVRTRDIV